MINSLKSGNSQDRTLVKTHDDVTTPYSPHSHSPQSYYTHTTLHSTTLTEYRLGHLLRCIHYTILTTFTVLHNAAITTTSPLYYTTLTLHHTILAITTLHHTHCAVTPTALHYRNYTIFIGFTLHYAVPALLCTVRYCTYSITYHHAKLGDTSLQYASFN